MNHKPTRAEFEANVRMKGEGPSKADLAKLYPDLFGSKTKKKKSAARLRRKPNKPVTFSTHPDGMIIPPGDFSFLRPAPPFYGPVVFGLPFPRGRFFMPKNPVTFDA